MKKIFTFILSASVFLLTFASVLPVHSASLAQDLSGKILLQVEENGEAWYIYPESQTRFFMGRPADAFDLMRNLGLGITTANLEKIPEAGSSSSGDLSLRQAVSGKILLQVEENGEAWYVFPDTLKRHYMGRPTDAFNLMRNLGLGISNENLLSIPIDPASVLPQGADPSNVAPLSDEYTATRTTILQNVNAERSSVQLASLSLSSTLTVAAQNQADDMTANNYFDFTSPTGKTMEDFLRESSYQAHIWANNIIQTNQGADQIIAVWKSQQSESLASVHNAAYGDVGIGVGQYQGVPVYVIVFAQSQQNYFESETAHLHDMEAMRSQMLVLLNERRAQEGLAPLTMNPLLEQAAQAHAQDMFNRSYYAHNTPEGATSYDRIVATGYSAQATGENIAKGQLSVQEVMTAWYNSPDHLANIISANFTEVGFGLSLGKNLNGYETLWVQNFGRPLE